MTSSIEYCLANVDAEARPRLRSRSNVREASCLEECGRCRATSFLVVDGRVRTGSDHDAILAGLDGER